MIALGDTAKALAAQKYMIMPIDRAGYRSMKYPSAFPIMWFYTSQFMVASIGNLFIMETNVMMGRMYLTTVVFTPLAKTALPFLLIDGLSTEKKNICYVEYYDLTPDGCDIVDSQTQRAEFADIPDYKERNAWYVPRRTPYSLIKGGKGVDEMTLCKMALTCVERYLASNKPCENPGKHFENLEKFQQEMIEKGNPSSSILKKVLGREGAAEMFKTAIMPVNFK